jgi:hypothetical protein
MINDKQFTIVWYVDDLKFSHVDSSVVNEMIEAVKSEFGKEYEVIIRRRRVQDYLGMQLDFSNKGKDVMTMSDYISELIKEIPEDLLSGKASTPASNFLFNINPNAANSTMKLLSYTITTQQSACIFQNGSVLTSSPLCLSYAQGYKSKIKTTGRNWVDV